jgi:molybdopterin-containing oxidoreductase family membrane subunit
LYLVQRPLGPYAWLFWLMLAANVVLPQLFWVHTMRVSPPVLWVVAMLILLGMWLERYMIVVVSLHRDFLPSSWGMYAGTVWDWALYVGTIGLFFALLFLFIRFLPVISIFELRELVEEQR